MMFLDAINEVRTSGIRSDIFQTEYRLQSVTDPETRKALIERLASLRKDLVDREFYWGLKVA